MRVLGSKNVQINDAHVMATHHGYALDTFSISEQDGLAIVDERRINSIVQTLIKSFTQLNFKIHNNKRIARQTKQFTVQTQVSFVTSDHNDYTLFELVALDVPGLLATIGDVFTKHKINLLNAKITTLGERVEDFFIITTSDGNPLNQEQEDKLQKSLITAIGKMNQS